MTAIVGFTKKGNVYIGCDSQGTGSTKSQLTNKKIFRNKDFIMGYTSSYRFGQILEYNFVPPIRKKQLTDLQYLVTAFIPELRKVLEEQKYTASNEKGESGVALLGYKGKLYQLQSEFSLLENKKGYSSVGSGSYHCEASLYHLLKTDLKPKDVIKKAIKCAIEHIPSVGGDIYSIKLKGERT